MTTSGRDWQGSDYVRVYHTIVGDDRKFERVYDDDRALAGWLRLLIAADAMYPAPPPLPRWLADDVLELLTDVGLIVVVRRNHYFVRGLEAEREARATGRAIGGKARAETAERDEYGRFLPPESANGSASSNISSKTAHGAPASSSKNQQQNQQPSSTRTLDSPAEPAKPSKAKTKLSRVRTSAIEDSSREADDSGPLLDARELEAWQRYSRPAWQPFRAAWLARGFRLPPAGDPDDTRSQAHIVWEILDNRPPDLPVWVAEAPGTTSHQVIAHLLERWRAIKAEAGIEDEPTPDVERDPTSTPESAKAILARLAGGPPT